MSNGQFGMTSGSTCDWVVNFRAMLRDCAVP
jgi:hypothetical protein